MNNISDNNYNDSFSVTTDGLINNPYKKLYIYDIFMVDMGGLYEDDIAWSNILDRINSSSDKIRKLFFSSEIIEILMDISGDFDLTRDQSANLTRIIKNILLGDLFLGDTVKTIKSKLNIDQEKAQAIANIIATEIFKPAINEIKEMQRMKFPDRINNQTKRNEPPENLPRSTPSDRPVENRPREDLVKPINEKPRMPQVPRPHPTPPINMANKTRESYKPRYSIPREPEQEQKSEQRTASRGNTLNLRDK
jgi:hypothetical protein